MEKRPTHICSVRPTTMKKIFTGSGNAKKEVVTAEAKKYYKFKKCWTKLNTETIADAIGILYCCYIFRRDGYGIPGIVEL